MWSSEENSSHFHFYMGSGDQTQVTRLVHSTFAAELYCQSISGIFTIKNYAGLSAKNLMSGRMPQWLRALMAALPRTPGGSQLFIMGSDSFFWQAGVHADTTIIILKINK